MRDDSSCIGRARLLTLAVALSLPIAGWAQGERTVAPALWGHGVKSCSAYLAAMPGPNTPVELASEEYLRYRQWLAGLVSGLNLAVGRDVLKGAELDAAMPRIAAICKEQPEADFFNASLRLIRSLGQLQRKDP